MRDKTERAIRLFAKRKKLAFLSCGRNASVTKCLCNLNRDAIHWGNPQAEYSIFLGSISFTVNICIL